MLHRILSLLVFSFLSINALAQQVRPWNSAKIYEKLHQLNRLGNVMYLAAHPDDENTRLLSYLVHQEHLNTTYLSLTRGDGGQNLIGTELGIELGLIRNYELLAAREIDGAEQAFTAVIDFGFSKTPEETFKHWDKQRLVDEVKNAIKKYRPDVIICRFPTTGEGGHGQHTASAIVAQEAFEQLRQEAYEFLPERVLFNAFRFGNRNTTQETQLKILTHQYNPLLGESYGELAGRSRSIHRSQGAGTPQSIGVQFEYFDLIAGTPYSDKLIDKDLSWNRIGRSDIGKLIENTIEQYDFTAPHKIIPQLLHIRRQILSIDEKDNYWKNLKLEEIDKIILSASGFMGEIFTDKPEMICGEHGKFKIQIIARYDNVTLSKIILPDSRTNILSTPITLSNDRVYEQEIDWTIPQNQEITQPYWLREAPQGAWYTHSEKIHNPSSDNKLVAEAEIEIGGERLKVLIPISYKYLNATRGDIVQALRIIPDVLITPIQGLYYRDPNKGVDITVKVRNNKPQSENVKLLVRSGDKILSQQSIRLPSSGKDSVITLHLPDHIFTKQREVLRVQIEDVSGKVFEKKQRLISYDHLPELVYYKNADITIVTKTWIQPDFKVGYIAGAGDLVLDHLKAMGIKAELIPDNWLSELERLQQYDVIICGVRAYNTNKQLVGSKDQIMEYIHRGGNFIVQYNTTAYLLTDNIGPYPFSIGRERVTEEDAEVQILNPTLPIFNTPNKISPKDFEGWYQERGLYFAENIDSRYTTLFSMHDEREAPHQGSSFYTKYGKGHFIYTSLSFFRQIPQGHEGAIKLFINMMSLK